MKADEFTGELCLTIHMSQGGIGKIILEKCREVVK